MVSDRHDATVRGRAHARARRLPWPPAIHAILWIDGVLLVAAALALAGMPPALGHGASAWTWLALAGSTLTAATAALSAFELSSRRPSRVWTWLPLPSFLIWIGASGLGCFGAGAEAWGATLEQAGRCLKFLLAISAPLLALMVFMLWRVAPEMPGRVMALGGLASAGAAATLLSLVHPHDAALLDLGAHVIALAIILGASAVAARLRPRRG